MERDENVGSDLRLFFYLIMIVFMSSLITMGVIILMASSPVPSLAKWFFGTSLGFLSGIAGLLFIIYRVKSQKEINILHVH